jgi:hypothetical protein
VVDRRVGLDRALDRRTVGCADLTVDRADDAARDGAVQPERIALESPSSTGLSFEAGASMCSTARSLEMSLPTTVAVYAEPSASLTRTELAPSTTCSFVTM